MMRRLLLLPMALCGTACGTDAVGVDDCQAIERVRCEEASACGRVDDVDACKRYYRGHCLHGLAVRSRPARDDREVCISAIQRAGACARAQGAETSLTACASGPPAEPLPERTLLTACDVILRPWDATACEFLTPVSPNASPGEGGASGMESP